MPWLLIFIVSLVVLIVSIALEGRTINTRFERLTNWMPFASIPVLVLSCVKVVIHYDLGGIVTAIGGIAFLVVIIGFLASAVWDEMGNGGY